MSDMKPSSAMYEAPRVERVLTSEDLQREVLYAGAGQSTPADFSTEN